MWQPIETAPRDGVEILIYDYDGTENASGIITAFWEKNEGYLDGGYWNDGSIHIFHPTHWMPLPEPPADQETEKKG